MEVRARPCGAPLQTPSFTLQLKVLTNCTPKTSNCAEAARNHALSGLPQQPYPVNHRKARLSKLKITDFCVDHGNASLCLRDPSHRGELGFPCFIVPLTVFWSSLEVPPLGYLRGTVLCRTGFMRGALERMQMPPEQFASRHIYTHVLILQNCTCKNLLTFTGA